MKISEDRIRVHKESRNEKTTNIKREENQIQDRSYSACKEKLRSSLIHESDRSYFWQMINTEL